jgi:hypothetical protein
VDVFEKLLHAIGGGVARFPRPTNNFRCSVGCLVLSQPSDVGYRLPVCVGDLDSGIDCFGLTAMARRGVLIKGGAFLGIRTRNGNLSTLSSSVSLVEGSSKARHEIMRYT